MFALVVSSRVQGLDVDWKTRPRDLPMRVITGNWADLEDALTYVTDNPDKVFVREGDSVMPCWITDTTTPEEGA